MSEKKPRYAPVNRKIWDDSLNFVTLPEVDFSRLASDTGRQYLADFYEAAACKFNFSGKKVLEIGGSNLPRWYIQGLGVEKWVSLDTPYWNEQNNPHKKDPVRIFDASSISLQNAWEQDTYFIMRGLTDDINEEYWGKFDIVVSCACIEHVINVDYAFDAIYKCMRDGGLCYLHWGPIWSSANGHHVWHPEIGLTFGNGVLPPYCHLTMSFVEIYEFLKAKFGIRKDLMALANEIKNLGYHLNHLFMEDYQYFFKNSLLSSCDYIFYPFRGKKPDAVMQKFLQSKYPNYSQFDVRSIRVFAQKQLEAK